jgi:hypothetical protein
MARHPPPAIVPGVNRFKRVIRSLLMNGLPRSLDRFFTELGEVPGEISRWATTLDDRTFLTIMLVGVLTLVLVVARALR